MPKSTAVAPVKPVPVMVTVVPPAVGPAVGLTAVTVGRGDVGELVGGRRVAQVPPGVVTVTSTVPPVPAGEVAVIWVSESTVKLVAGRRAEVDGGGAGEAGAGDGDRGAAGGRAGGRARAGDRRRGDVGELVGRGSGRGAAGVVTVTSTVPRAGRRGGGDRGGRVRP